MGDSGSAKFSAVGTFHSPIVIGLVTFKPQSTRHAQTEDRRTSCMSRRVALSIPTTRERWNRRPNQSQVTLLQTTISLPAKDAGDANSNARGRNRSVPIARNMVSLSVAMDENAEKSQLTQ